MDNTLSVREPQPVLSIKNLVKYFGDREILKGISFAVDPGDVICIIGASGSGKSTLLRCINLLETPTSGEIIHENRNVVEDQDKLTW